MRKCLTGNIFGSRVTQIYVLNVERAKEELKIAAGVSFSGSGKIVLVRGWGLVGNSFNVIIND